MCVMCPHLTLLKLQAPKTRSLISSIQSKVKAVLNADKPKDSDAVAAASGRKRGGTPIVWQPNRAVMTQCDGSEQANVQGHGQHMAGPQVHSCPRLFLLSLSSDSQHLPAHCHVTNVKLFVMCVGNGNTQSTRTRFRQACLCV